MYIYRASGEPGQNARTFSLFQHLPVVGSPSNGRVVVASSKARTILGFFGMGTSAFLNVMRQFLQGGPQGLNYFFSTLGGDNPTPWGVASLFPIVSYLRSRTANMLSKTSLFEMYNAMARVGWLLLPH